MRGNSGPAMYRLDDDRPHPMFPHPVYWELVEFTYRGDPADWRESYIDLVFEAPEGERRFRFFAPREVGWTGQLPARSGLFVLDASTRQWENVSVLVCRTEPMQDDGPQFMASRVIEVSDQHG